MSDLVHLLVQAPVHHMPPRSRVPRLSYLPIAVPARLRDLGADSHAPGPDIPTPGGRVLRTRIVDGELWRPVRRDDGISARPEKGVSADLFRQWLQGAEEAAFLDTRDTARCFAGTTLVARLTRSKGHHRSYPGDAPEAFGRILWDRREVAATTGRDFLESEVALLSGEPHMRMRGPVSYLDHKAGSLRIMRHPGALGSHPAALHAIPFRVDRNAEQLRFEDRPWEGDDAIAPDWGRNLFDGIAFRRDDDVEQAAKDALRLLEGALERPWTSPHPPERDARLAELSADASVGLIADDEIEAAYEFIVAAAADHAERGEDEWARVASRKYARYATSFALPLIRDRLKLDAEDAEALSAFAP